MWRLCQRAQVHRVLNSFIISLAMRGVYIDIYFHYCESPQCFLYINMPVACKQNSFVQKGTVMSLSRVLCFTVVEPCQGKLATDCSGFEPTPGWTLHILIRTLYQRAFRLTPRTTRPQRLVKIWSDFSYITNRRVYTCHFSLPVSAIVSTLTLRSY